MIGLDDFAFECRAAAALCRQVAQEDLAGRGCYVVPQAALPARLDILPNALSYCHHENDLFLEPYLRAEGVWQGRGFACAVREHPQTASPWGVDAVALHELAHWVGDDSLMGKAMLRRGIRDTSPWSGHGADFIRACIHLAFRAASRGTFIPLSSIRFAGDGNYGLRFAANVYQAALGDEPARWFGKPIRWVLLQEYPRPFATLWDADTRRRAAC